jgi:hypothetical protein
VTPDGLILALAGPFEGKASDATMLRESGVIERLSQMFEDSQDNEAKMLFGDKGYSCNECVLCPFPEPCKTTEEQAFNDSLQVSRLAVEWAFGWVLNNFSANHFKHNLRSGLQPVGAIWSVSVLLANCLTCMKARGNQISMYFGVRPMTIEEYLNLGESG